MWVLLVCMLLYIYSSAPQYILGFGHANKPAELILKENHIVYLVNKIPGMWMP